MTAALCSGHRERTYTLTSQGSTESAHAEPSILASALGIRDKEWPIVLLYGVLPNEEGALECECSNPSCDRPGKHPRLKRWRQRATTNPYVIQSWFRTWPNSNVGIVTGRRFGVVIDADPRHGSDA